MMRSIALGLCLFVVGTAVACGDDSDSSAGPTSATSAVSSGASSGGMGGTTAAGGSGGETSASGGGGANGGAGGMGGAAGGAGGMACTPPTAIVDGQGCLTFAGGNAICADDPTAAVCNKAIACGISTGTLSECHINCSQGVVVGECYTQADVDCVYNAVVCNDSCNDLSACHWPFF